MEAATPPPGPSGVGEMHINKAWWLWLVTGICWIIVALVILQFDDASVNTVGVIIGLMFLFAGIQNLILAFLADSLKWLYAIFAVLLLAGGVIALISPENTFAALADSLGFIFLVVGLFWVMDAFFQKGVNELWWLALVSGILMIILAFWTGGQFFIDKQYLLLVFAGIWSLMQGVRDIVLAFAIRKLPI